VGAVRFSDGRFLLSVGTVVKFGRLGRRVVEGDFSGSAISSDAGLLLLC